MNTGEQKNQILSIDTAIKNIPVGSLSVFCTILNHAGLTFYSEDRMLEMLDQNVWHHIPQDSYLRTRRTLFKFSIWFLPAVIKTLCCRDAIHFTLLAAVPSICCCMAALLPAFTLLILPVTFHTVPVVAQCCK